MQRLALLLLVGCSCETFAPNATRFDPPPSFADYWREMETCSGQSGAMERIRWHVVPAGQLVLDGVKRSGVWQAPHDIYLTDVILDHLDRYAVQVKHEMLHDLGFAHGPMFATCGVD